MATKKPESPPALLQVDLGKNGGRFAFRNVAELDAWITKEQDFWSWLSQVNIGDNAPSNLWQRFAGPVHQIKNVIAEAARNDSSPNRQQFLNNIGASIQSAYSTGVWPLHSSTPTARFVNDLRATDQISAAYAMCFLCGLQVNTGNPSVFQGVLQAAFYKAGVPWREVEKSSQPYKTALEDLARNWAGVLESQRVDLETKISAVEKLLEDGGSAHAARATQFEAQLSEHSTSLKQALEVAEANLESIANTYDQKLALQAPVKYWNIRRRAHSKLARIYGLLAGGAMTIFCALLVSELHEQLLTLKPGEQPAYWKLAGFAVLATIAIWVTRILVRIFLSNLHLAGDAAERVTMVQTFLALTRKGITKRDEEIALILQALFRSAADGIVKDEGMPPAVFEYLTRSTPSK